MKQLLIRQLAGLASAGTMTPLQRLRALWGVLVDSTLAERSRPDAIGSGRLVVAVANPAVAQELQLASAQILRVLRKHQDVLQLPPFDQINSRVLAAAFPGVQSVKRVHTPGPDGNTIMPRTAQPTSERVENALDDIEDDDLRARLRRLARS